MKRAKSHLFRCLVFGLLCNASLSLPAAQAQSGEQSEIRRAVPENFSLPREEFNTAAERRKLLAELYDRLSAADTPDNAELIASAIENMWLLSGSDTVDLLMSRAGILMQGDQPETALNILNSVIEIAPEYSEAWSRRAAIHFNRKDFGKSLDDLRHALALDPSHYKAIQGLGLLMRELGDKQAALQAVRKALKVHPHLEDARQAEIELTREVEGQGI